MVYPYHRYSARGHSAFTGRIGITRRDINPPVGIYSRNWAAGVHDVAVGIHRTLTLTCLTLQSADDQPPLVLLSADLGWWKSATDERSLRTGILNAVGLEEPRLMLCLSHTHAGPGLFTEDENKPGGDLIAPYLALLKEQAVSAIEEALETARPSVLEWQYGTCGLAANRDQYYLEENRILVGYNPDTPADDTLLVGRIADADNRIRGVIVNYACHPTTLAWENRLLSPDYVGAMRELVESRTGGLCLFLQGASGDLAPARQYTGDTEYADACGRQLGYAVLSTVEGMRPPGKGLAFSHVVESGASLAIWKETDYPQSSVLRAEVKPVSLELKDLPSLEEIEEQWKASVNPVEKERLWRKRGIRKSLGEGRSAVMPLWVWRLGGTCLAGQPNEAYSSYQQQVRQALSPVPVAVMNIVNGYAGYLPPKKHYRNNMYAVWQTPFASGSLEKLQSATIASLQKLVK